MFYFAWIFLFYMRLLMHTHFSFRLLQTGSECNFSAVVFISHKSMNTPHAFRDNEV
jgi:hypothetical protein